MSFPFNTRKMIGRIIERSTELGLSIESVCETTGTLPDYFDASKNNAVTFSDNQIDMIATILKVSPEYLKFGFSVSPDFGMTTEDFLYTMLDCPTNPTERDKRVLTAAVEMAKLADEHN